MGNVIANMSMSLDGFIEDRTGDVQQHLFRWYEHGGDVLEEAMAGLGALVCGRTLFDLTQGWGGQHPTGAPVFVVTHEAPGDWKHPDAPFTFVTDGVQSAIEQASRQAGDKTIAVASADIARQCLELGLLDAIAVDLVPVILGAGKPWFAGTSEVVELEDPVITPGEGVIHLRYTVKR